MRRLRKASILTALFLGIGFAALIDYWDPWHDVPWPNPTEAKATTLPLVGVQGTNPAICPPEMGPDVCVNQFITGILNPGLAGQVAALSAPATFAATTAQTFLTYVLAPSAQTNAPTLGIGKVLRVTAWGTTTNLGTNTFTLNFGTATAAVVVATTTATNWKAVCEIQNTGTAASPNQSIDCRAFSNATVVTGSQPSSTQALTSAITVTLQSTNTSASAMTTAGAYIEVVQ